MSENKELIDIVDGYMDRMCELYRADMWKEMASMMMSCRAVCRLSTPLFKLQTQDLYPETLFEYDTPLTCVNDEKINSVIMFEGVNQVDIYWNTNKFEYESLRLSMTTEEWMEVFFVASANMGICYHDFGLDFKKEGRKVILRCYS